MPERLIGKLSRNLRSLINGGADRTATHVIDIATIGLTGRVRDEWQTRQRNRVVVPFALPDLLRSLHRGKTGSANVAALVDEERRPHRLPERGIGRDGRMQPLDDAFFARRDYSVYELTCFADAVFVEIAYRCVLKRPPDPVGFSTALLPLREGSRERVDVLDALSTSTEGSQQQVTIRGLRTLLLWRRVERIRHVGAIAAWVHALVDVRRKAQRLAALEARMEANHQALTRQLDALTAAEIVQNREAIVALEQSQVRVETAVVGLGDRYRRFLLEFEMREAARTSSRDAAEKEHDRS